MQPDPVKFILENLPAYIQYKEYYFELEIFKNHSYEMRLSYALISHNIKGDITEWDNPFLDKQCDYLFIYETITSVDKLLEAAQQCHHFLLENKLISK